MKRRYQAVTFIVLVLVIALTVSIAMDRHKQGPVLVPENTTTDETKTGTEQGEQANDIEDMSVEYPEFITRSMAVKMVALALEDMTTIRTMDREIDFSDSARTDWFDKYFNAGIVAGWYQSKESLLKPEEPITYSQVESILQFFKLSGDVMGVKNPKPEDSVKYEDFLKAYEQILLTQSQDSAPESRSLYVFATPTVSSELGSWEMATDAGVFSFEGIQMDGCLYHKIHVFVRGNEIIYIKGVSAKEAELTNAYILSKDQDLKTLSVFMGGVTRSLQATEEAFEASSEKILADLLIQDDRITQAQYKTTTTRGVTKMISEDWIEIDGVGKLPIAQDAKFYKDFEEVTFSDYMAALVGSDMGDIYLENDQVVGMVINDEADLSHIRVLLQTSGFASMVHANVIMTSDQPYTIASKTIDQIKAGGETLDVTTLNMAVGERIIITPENGGRMKVTSIERGPSSSLFNPSYRGFLEIERTEQGYYLINEVDFEEYLYSVVPSEMPSAYGLEAAKIQAICARSYAYSQMLGNRFCAYGAHVDDSVTSQVYNNIAETDQSILAVDETKGQLLSYGGNVISANFFSTSCGMTAASGDVWANYGSKEFPTSSPEYLQNTYQNDSGEMSLDLTDEEQFKEFIVDQDYPSYDSAFSWYRWETQMSRAQIEATINEMIGPRYEIQPKLIKTLDEKDVFKSRPVDNIGELLDIWVYSRGESGIITEIMIQGTNGIYKVATEYNIRALIAPKNLLTDGTDVVVTRKDGSTSKNIALMPSAYYYMDKKYDDNGNLAEVTFYGGGYGHGVGMSQNGVKTMVEKGFTYKEILQHYYPGTELKAME